MIKVSGNEMRSTAVDRQNLVDDLTTIGLRLDVLGEHAAAAHVSMAADILARTKGGHGEGRCA